MGVKSFFKKLWGGVKRIGGKVWSGLKKAGQFVGKIAKPIINIAKPVLNGLSLLPGKVGMIGKVGSAASEVAKQIVDRIPNQQAKDKLNRVIDKGQETLNKVQDRAQGIADKAKPWANAGLSMIHRPPSLAPIKKAVMSN